MSEPGAAVYTRQSKGKERSIEEQEADGRAACAEYGWRVLEVYTDTVSASRFARKDRPDWARLLADLEAARFGVLVMWESSRGDRDAETWLGLLRRCREHAVLIHVVSHERTYDMRKRRDWRTLADEGVDSADESWKISERVKRGMRNNATSGRPHGVTLYGYERVYDQRTREFVEQHPHPEHAAIVREVFGAVAAGTPLSRIAASLNQRGVPAPKGGAWGRATIRQLAGNPGYIGKRRAGSTTGRRVFTEIHDAVWPPLVDEVTFWKVQRILGDPARKTARPGRRKYLLSYFATCHECGAPLSVFRAGTLYGCSANGCVYISLPALDGYVHGKLREVAPMVEAAAAETRGSAPSGEDAARAQAEADEMQARLDEHARMSARGQITPRALAIIEAELAPKIQAAEARAARAARPGLGDYVPIAAGLYEEWPTFPVARRREMLSHLCRISVRKRLRKVGKGGIDPDRVIFTWAWEDSTG